MAKKRAASEGHDSTKKRKKAKKDSPFRDVAVRGTFALLPHCLDDVKGHILRRLHALLMRHSSALSGVPLAVRDVKLAPGQTLGRVQGTDPRIRVSVRLRCTVFAPQTDCVLPGRVNAIAPNYVGLLVHGYFNASIAASDLRPLHFDSGGACWRNNQQKVEVGPLVRFRLGLQVALPGRPTPKVTSGDPSPPFLPGRGAASLLRSPRAVATSSASVRLQWEPLADATCRPKTEWEVQFTRSEP